MGVNIQIKQKKRIKKQITVPGIAELKDLSYGVANENDILIDGETGKITVLYDKENMGRGFDVWQEDDDIFMRLALPACAGDIVNFYTLTECLCLKMGVTEFIRDEEVYPVEYCNMFIQRDTDASIQILEEISRKILSGEMDSFVVFGALNPVSLGVKEINRIAGSLENFEELLHELQSRQLYFASARYYENDKKEVIGMFFTEEYLPTAVPYDPERSFDEEDEISAWYMILPCGVCLKYEDFAENVPGKSGYDAARFVVNLSEDDINSLAEKYAIDLASGERTQNPYKGKLLDCGSWHYDKITAMNLAAERMSGYNHIAAMLYWAAKNDHLAICGDIKEKILSGEDIRDIIHNGEDFRGELRTYHFSEDVRDFLRKFYVFETQGEESYPYCVDLYAEKYFGEKYHSAEFRNEAYLFVPYSGEYLTDMAEYIQEAYQKFIK